MERKGTRAVTSRTRQERVSSEWRRVGTRNLLVTDQVWCFAGAGRVEHEFPHVFCNESQAERSKQEQLYNNIQKSPGEQKHRHCSGSQVKGQSFGEIEMVKFATREQVQQQTVEQVVPLVTDQGTVEV